MIRISCALSGAIVLACSTAAAQTEVPITAPDVTAVETKMGTAVVLGSADASMLRTGTAILLKTSEPLTTKGKKLKVGQRVQMEVAEAIMLNDQVVIPAGSPAMGELTAIRNKGMWGKSGGINARALYVRVNGRQIRLTGQFDDKGKTGTVGVVAAIAFIPIAGFFTTGTSAEIPIGMPVKAFLDEDIAIQLIPAASAAPLLVPATPAAMLSPAAAMVPAVAMQPD